MCNLMEKKKFTLRSICKEGVTQAIAKERCKFDFFICNQMQVEIDFVKNKQNKMKH